MTGELDVPDEFHDWPYEAKAFVLAEANDMVALREAIEARAGMDKTDPETAHSGQFDKEQMAQLVMALGGPEESDSS